MKFVFKRGFFDDPSIGFFPNSNGNILQCEVTDDQGEYSSTSIVEINKANFAEHLSEILTDSCRMIEEAMYEPHKNRKEN